MCSSDLALLHMLAPGIPRPGPACGDGVRMARAIYEAARPNLAGAVLGARNGARLAEIPDLAGDLAVCMAEDCLDVVAGTDADGVIRAMRGQ